MKNTHHNFILILLVAILFGGVYFYFISDLKSEAANSDLSSSSDKLNTSLTPSLLISGSDNLARDTAFLATLGTLKSIKIDPSIFESPAFRALNYNVVTIEQATPGRNNPFLPVTTLAPIAPTKTNGFLN